MGKARVLLVDDEKLILKSYPKELESAGFDVKTADNGKKAIDIVSEDDIDIAYVDLKMPEMNGVQLCQQIKTISPKTEVVLISGHPQEVEVCLMSFLKNGGRDEFLRKPLFENELIRATEKLWNEIFAKRCALN